MTNRALITGCDGFIGSHLAEFLVGQALEVHGMVFHDTKFIDHLGKNINLHRCDITEKDKVSAIVTEVKPDYIFHLAAQSLISDSWRNPELTFRINTIGTLNLLEAARVARIDPLIEIVGSSDEYASPSAQNIRIKESAALNPSSPYGISKLAADMLGHVYSQTYGMKVICVRPFSIIGPRKTGDACSEFTQGIVEIESGKKSKLGVGNLEAIRDFLDVKDAVKAMWLLAERGKPGEAYNVCSGKGTTIQEILDKMISMSSHRIIYEQVLERTRLTDKLSLIGDCSKLQSLGWRPSILLEKTLADILEYWRALN